MKIGKKVFQKNPKKFALKLSGMRYCVLNVETSW